jgi:adenylate cyclase class 2
MPLQTEIEVKYLDVEFADIRKRLEKLGAECEHPMRNMRRALIEEPHHKTKRGFIRIRDEGNKTTMTYKQRDDEFHMHGTKEIEIEVSDFQNTIDLLEAAGWPTMTYQESRRETWKLGDVEIVLDQWPWIPDYIEIEAPTEEKVRETAEALGFDWKDHVVGSVDIIYNREYPNMTNRGVIDIKKVRFDDPLPKEFA